MSMVNIHKKSIPDVLYNADLQNFGYVIKNLQN